MTENAKVGPSCPYPRPATWSGFSGLTWLQSWRIVETEYRCEKLAEVEIKALGYLVYVPRYRTRQRDRSRNRKWIDVQRPLLPGYVFASIPGTDPWTYIESRRGVRELLRLGENEPARVPDQVVEKLQAEEGINFNQPYRTAGPAIPFKADDPVRVTDGPFTGFLGLIESVDAKDRITVLIEFLGRVSKVGPLLADQVEGAR